MPEVYIEFLAYGEKTVSVYRAIRNIRKFNGSYTYRVAVEFTKEILDAIVHKGYELLWMADIKREESLKECGYNMVKDATFVQEYVGYKETIEIRNNAIYPYYSENGDDTEYSLEIPYQVLCAIKHQIETPVISEYEV